MPSTTCMIDHDQRDGLYEPVRNHLGGIGDIWIALEQNKDFATAERLGLEFGEDFRLLEDIGWGEDEGREGVELTMPPHDLMELLKPSTTKPNGCFWSRGPSGGHEKKTKSPTSATSSAWTPARNCWSSLMRGRVSQHERHPEKTPPPRRAGWPRSLLPLQARKGRAAHRQRNRKGNRPILRRRSQLPGTAGKGEGGAPGQKAPPHLRRKGEAAMRASIGRSGNGRRPPFPESTPPEINHAVLTGTLSADPQEGRSPTGDRVTLLRIEFPVADPDHPQALWTWASCVVEGPGDRARQDVEKLHGGASVLAAGQLSDRWMIENGHTSRRGVIVATLVKSGPLQIQGGLLQ